jgi:hypothetical protein
VALFPADGPLPAGMAQCVRRIRDGLDIRPYPHASHVCCGRLVQITVLDDDDKPLRPLRARILARTAATAPYAALLVVEKTREDLRLS